MTSEKVRVVDGSAVFTFDDALNALKALETLEGASLTFSALEPDDLTVVKGHQIMITPAATVELAQVAKSTIDKVINSTQIEYGPTVLIPPSYCMHTSKTVAANLSSIQEQVEKKDFDEYVSTSKYADKIVLFAANFKLPDNHNVTFYRVSESLLQLKKKKILSLILKNGKYDRLEPADLLLIRNEFDVIVIRGHAFFFTKNRFERAFGFLAELQKSSGKTFDLVTTSLKIKGKEELRQACTSQPQMMAKMASIARSMEENKEYAAAMTMPSLLTFIRDHAGLGILIEGVGDDQKFVFNPLPATRFKILNLLDDDYLNSTLTKIEYEANSKVRT